MKITAVQFNPILGDMYGNVTRMIHLANAAEKTEIIVFGECAVTGYQQEDLLFRKDFVAEAEKQTERFVEETRNLDVPVIFGSIIAADVGAYNVAITSFKGEIINVTKKHMRANGYIFDEMRTFKRGTLEELETVTIGNKKIGVVICEDMWHPDVVDVHKRNGADVIVSINGSPYEQGKYKVREEVAKQRYDENHIPIFYVNLVGGQDSTVFDGHSFVYYGGEVRDHLPAFKEGHFVLNLNANNPFPEIDELGMNYQASVKGLRDFCWKQGFHKVILGLSGGLDSSVVTSIAADALGVHNVTAVSLPSKYSSEGSKDDAYEQAKRMGLKDFRIIEIEPVVQSLRNAYQSQVIPANSDPQDFSQKLTGTADENIQARARMTILMSISNQEGMMLLGTSNKSEGAVGYGTLFGDMASCFNPIQDFYKSDLFNVARWRNSVTKEQGAEFGFFGAGDVEIVPEEVISKPPSAELSPEQKDSDSLPDYPTLDAIIRLIIEDRLSVDEIIDRGFDLEMARKVNRLIYQSEFKRKMAPPGVRISNTMFNRDRRYPIVNKFR